MIPLALFALTGCLAIGPEAAGIRAGDLAPLWPGLSDENAVVSAAPVPGVPRIFAIPELRRLAARFHQSTESLRPICFERPVAPPDPTRLAEAMRRTLPQGTFEILDYARGPVPEGLIEFPLTGLRRAGPDGFWNGWVSYGGGRHFSLWARVRVAVTEELVLAAEPLRPGATIAASQVRLEACRVFPGESSFARSVDAVAGRPARVAIPAGASIRLDWLAQPQDVQRGDRVVVEVYSGAARLRFEATAEASGSAGAVIPLTNPVSKKRFSARIEGKGRVSVGKGSS